jgi:hypothetical protein
MRETRTYGSVGGCGPTTWSVRPYPDFAVRGTLEVTTHLDRDRDLRSCIAMSSHASPQVSSGAGSP